MSSCNIVIHANVGLNFSTLCIRYLCHCGLPNELIFNATVYLWCDKHCEMVI